MNTAFDLPSPLPTRRPPARTVRSADPVDEAPAGCGWYDSSRDLLQGLDVCEHRTLDPLAAELPLADWIALQLRDGAGCHGA